jgi:hypothetical protein
MILAATRESAQSVDRTVLIAGVRLPIHATMSHTTRVRLDRIHLRLVREDETC